MIEKELLKIGYYTIYEVKTKLKTFYRVDSGKTLYIARFKKYIFNPYRDLKEFPTLEKAKQYATKKITKKLKEKKKKIEKLPKSLYLILMKEESTGKTFVKVGITCKKHIADRFTKFFGYEGYTLIEILRRIESPDTIRLEKEIKEELNKKRSIKKYRPILESFSGYSECYDFLSLDEIIKIFDKLTD